jgi:hypothetical protein
VGGADRADRAGQRESAESGFELVTSGGADIGGAVVGRVASPVLSESPQPAMVSQLRAIDQ